ncbi:hypothetical protein MCEMIEM13_00622 [Comamonadaceae bacterium]
MYTHHIEKKEIDFNILYVLIFLFVTTSCVASEVNTIYGAGLHLGQGKHEASMATASLRVMGLNSFRDEIYWSRFEDVDGKFRIERIPPELRKALEDPRLGQRAMIILGYGNDRYDGGGRPTTDAGRAAFTRYALEVSRTYPRLGYLEIWNEWNHAIGVKDGSKGNADDYVKLVASTATALRNSGTKSKIIIGGLADDLPDWPFARSLVQKGILRYADAFSVHLYNYSAGNKATPAEMFERLNRLQEILRTGNGGKDFPIMVTEMGWPTHEGKTSTTEIQSGAFLSQFIFEATTYPWLQGVWIYELFNSGTNPTDREHNFGILKNNGAVKAGTCAIRETLALLKGAQYAKQGTTAGGAHWIQFRSGEKSFFVAYSPKRNGDSEVAIASELLESTIRLCGASIQMPNTKTAATFTPMAVSNTPIVIWSSDANAVVANVLR